MTLRKLSADFSDRDLAYSASGALQDLLEPAPDALTIFENGPGRWRVEAYFSEPAPSRDFAAELARVIDAPLPAFAFEAVPDSNWVAMSQAALPPVSAGRFTIHGSHDSGRVPRGVNAILIDAGEAFGTAHHATTYGCLLAIDRLTRRRHHAVALDLGCGSGVLAIAIARALPAARIVATDLDVQSVRVAKSNAALNGVASRIEFAAAAGVDHPVIRALPPVDLVVANILAGPLIALAKDISRVVRRGGGSLVLSGLLTTQAAAVLSAYRAAGFDVVRHDRIAGWSTLTLVRR